MAQYHGIVVEESLHLNALKKLKVLARRMAIDGSFILLKISFAEEELKDMINFIKNNLKTGKWYAHFYKDSELIVIFKEKVFHVTTDRKTWKAVIDFGLEKGIPEKQMNIKPVSIDEETW